jgi:heptosyltransferase-2
MVMAQSLFKLLKQQHAEAVIDVLAPAWSFPLLARMPEVRQGIELPVGHGTFGWSVRKQIGKRLRGQYDLAIVLPNTWKSALVPWFAKVPKRSGFRGEMRYGLLNDLRLLDKQKLPGMVQRYVALGVAANDPLPDVPSPLLDVPVAEVTQTLVALSLNKKAQTSVLGLCPGAEYGLAKRWPEKNYAELAQAYIAQGWDVWLFGSDKDQQVCAQINTLCGDACTNLAGQTSLQQAIDLLSMTNAVVTNDSGLMHVAAALNKPLVAVYGSSDPHYTPPLNSRSEVVSLNVDCSPCFQRECPLGHLDCLEKLPVELVEKKLNQLI